LDVESGVNAAFHSLESVRDSVSSSHATRARRPSVTGSMAMSFRPSSRPLMYATREAIPRRLSNKNISHLCSSRCQTTLWHPRCSAAASKSCWITPNRSPLSYSWTGMDSDLPRTTSVDAESLLTGFRKVWSCCVLVSKQRKYIPMSVPLVFNHT